MSDLYFTPINEVAAAALDITRDEYALCNYIAVHSVNPKNKVPGYCERTLEQKAAFIRITTRGLTKMQNKLIEMGLLEKAPNSPLIRITQKWFEATHGKELCSQSDREQSSHKQGTKFPQTGNKVPTHIYSIYSNNTTTKEMKSDFQSKNEEPNGHPPQPSNQSGVIYRPEEIAAKFGDDFLIRDAFTISRGMPADIFETCLRGFIAEISGTGETYSNRPALVRHFLSWSQRSQYYQQGPKKHGPTRRGVNDNERTVATHFDPAKGSFKHKR